MSKAVGLGERDLEHSRNAGSLSFLGTKEQNQSKWKSARRLRRLSAQNAVLLDLRGEWESQKVTEREVSCSLDWQVPPKAHVWKAWCPIAILREKLQESDVHLINRHESGLRV